MPGKNGKMAKWIDCNMQSEVENGNTVKGIKI